MWEVIEKVIRSIVFILEANIAACRLSTREQDGQVDSGTDKIDSENDFLSVDITKGGSISYAYIRTKLIYTCTTSGVGYEKPLSIIDTIA